MASEKKIRIMPNGPYEVTGDVPLNQAIIEPNAEGKSHDWKAGKEYPQQPEEGYHLCRCGHSKDKPFCDGTHNHNHFDGKETANHLPYDQKAKRYRGDTVDLLDCEEFCAVARFCDVGESVWEYAVSSSQEGYEAEAIRQSCACPSGRLIIQRKNGERVEPDLPQEISAVQDPATDHRGPLWVKGGIQVEGADGRTYEVRNRVTLCRCGESSNMPFCDASHLRCKHMEGHDE